MSGLFVNVPGTHFRPSCYRMNEGSLLFQEDFKFKFHRFHANQTYHPYMLGGGLTNQSLFFCRAFFMNSKTLNSCVHE